MTCTQVNPDDLVYESMYWRVILCDDQAYLGRSIIALKRHARHLSVLSAAEWQDFSLLAKKLEHAFMAAFDARMFNWTALMNSGYKVNPYDAHVHWHIRPRYDHTIAIAGHTFIDPNFSHHYERKTDLHVSLTVRKNIIDMLRKEL